MKKGVALFMLLLVGLLTVAVATTGCNSTTPEQAKAQLSTDLQSLQVALQGMINPTVYASVDNFNAAWKDVETAYNDVAKSAKEVKDVNVKNLKSAFDEVKKAIGNIGSSESLQQKAADIADALTNFQKAWQEAFSSLNSIE
jgi:hypothetical protein